jgi:hypothetical protein
MTEGGRWLDLEVDLEPALEDDKRLGSPSSLGNASYTQTGRIVPIQASDCV